MQHTHTQPSKARKILQTWGWKPKFEIDSAEKRWQTDCEPVIIAEKGKWKTHNFNFDNTESWIAFVFLVGYHPLHCCSRVIIRVRRWRAHVLAPVMTPAPILALSSAEATSSSAPHDTLTLSQWFCHQKLGSTPNIHIPSISFSHQIYISTRFPSRNVSCRNESWTPARHTIVRLCGGISVDAQLISCQTQSTDAFITCAILRILKEYWSTFHFLSVRPQVTGVTPQLFSVIWWHMGFISV